MDRPENNNYVQSTDETADGLCGMVKPPQWQHEIDRQATAKNRIEQLLEEPWAAAADLAGKVAADSASTIEKMRT
jgi:hypothetical protein